MRTLRVIVVPLSNAALCPCLQQSELGLTTTILNRTPWNRWSGANRMAGLGIRMNLGVILSDPEIVTNAYKGIWTFLTVQPGKHCDQLNGAWVDIKRSLRRELIWPHRSRALVCPCL